MIFKFSNYTWQTKSTTRKSHNTSKSISSIGTSTTRLNNIKINCLLRISPSKAPPQKMLVKPSWKVCSRSLQQKQKINFNWRRKTKRKIKNIKRFCRLGDRFSPSPSIYSKSSTTSRKEDQNTSHSMKQ